MRNNIPCMAHAIQLALGVIKSSLTVKVHTKSSEAHQRDQQCGEKESIDIGKIQRLRKEGNTRINNMAAKRPGLAKIIDRVCISRELESPNTVLHKTENACFIDCADTRSSKQVH
jgi:hypothetical protein